jgi:hypothetical protein
MSPLVGLAEENGGQVPDSAFVRQTIAPGPRKSAEAELFTEARGVADGHLEAATGILDLSSTHAA